MKKDSTAKEVVRQLDLESSDKGPSDNTSSTHDRATSGPGDNSATEVTNIAANIPQGILPRHGHTGAPIPNATTQQHPFHSVFAPAQPQQLIIQGLAAHQQMEWHRQQHQMAAARMNVFPPWALLPNQNFPHALSLTSTLASSMEQMGSHQGQGNSQSVAGRPSLKEASLRTARPDDAPTSPPGNDDEAASKDLDQDIETASSQGKGRKDVAD
jgi:hypothetical protein